MSDQVGSPDDNVPLAIKKETLQRSKSQESLNSGLRKTPSMEQLNGLDPNCVCSQVYQNDTPRVCKACHGHFPAVVKLVQEKSFLAQELSNARLKLDKLIDQDKKPKTCSLQARIDQLEGLLDQKKEEIAKMKQDMEVLGQKLIDEVERRAEIQHANENVNIELEELTQSLFEEANSLVAKEAKERHSTQEKLQALTAQLQETKLYLQVEQTQVRELRNRIAQLEQDHETALIKAEREKAKPRIPIEDPNGNVEELIDPVLFQQFKELKDKAPRLKVSQLSDLIFMRNSLEDDVIPCLRFGGNPRTSTKKFIDAIVANTCFIEEMTAAQVNELVERDERHARASQASLEKQTLETPTTSLFNKTVLERLTTVLSTPSASGPSEQPGCSTCGRDEPYRYRFKISDVQKDVWYPICLDCRARLMAVVDFYQFVRDMRQGLFTTRTTEELYLEVLTLKRAIFYTRTGCRKARNPDSLFRQIYPIRPNSSLLLAVTPLVDSKDSPTTIPPPLEILNPNNK